LNFILGLFQLIGGLGLFLYGMHVMSDRIYMRAGDGFKRILRTLTNNRFAGVATGLTVTCIVQSSSATTVLLVSLVNAGLITLEQSIGVIMGANIGTTFTAWIVSIVGFKFNITALSLPAIAVAIPLYLNKKEHLREYAEILISFGILFLGLQFMKDSVPDLKNNPEVFAFVANLATYGFFSVILFIFIGTLLTIVIQSSSATMAITIMMAYKGWINFELAAAMVLGENIGTTITAFLASLGMNISARRAARAHMLFNLIGVSWMLILFPVFLSFIDNMVPGSARDSMNLPFHLSAFHSTFNIINTCLMIGFVKQFSSVVKFIIKEPPAVPDQEYKVRLIPGNIPESVESNLITIQQEINKMSEIVHHMLIRLMNATPGNTEDFQEIIDEIIEKERLTDRMQEVIINLLTECTVEALSEQQARRVYAIQRITNELESVADSCENMAKLLRRRSKKNLQFHDTGVDELIDYTSLVLDFLQYNTDYLNGKVLKYDIDHALALEKAINKQRKKLRKNTQIQLSQGADVQAELVFIDMVKNLEHIGDYSLNISFAMRELH
jgi:phosphate:Na+ symporter